jgi:S-adenosylmethionine hydrolase
MSMPYEKSHLDGKQLKGHIPILDVQYGNVWTNIEREKLVALGMSPGDSAQVTISENGNVIYDETIPYVKTFGEVNKGNAAIYINDLLNVAFAINQGDFAATFGVNSGPQWSVQIVKVP